MLIRRERRRYPAIQAAVDTLQIGWKFCYNSKFVKEFYFFWNLNSKRVFSRGYSVGLSRAYFRKDLFFSIFVDFIPGNILRNLAKFLSREIYFAKKTLG